MSESDLIPCNPPGFIHVPDDKTPKYCEVQEIDCNDQVIKKTLKEVAGRDFSWLEEATQNKTGIGQSALCDPIIKGFISNNQSPTPEPDALYRYSKAIRGCDEAMLNLFNDIIVKDEENKEYAVPIIPATQEKAVAYILADNVRKDESLVVDRIRLPILSICSTGISFDQKRYAYHKAVDYLRDLRGRPGFTSKDRKTVFGLAKGIPLDIQYTIYIWTMHRED